MSATVSQLPSLLEIRRQLVNTFNDILHTRMQGVPVIHTGLPVSADQFITWQGYFLGVMVTPWFMNLMLLPATEGSKSHFDGLKVGRKETHIFPSGPYEFIIGNEPSLGNFQSCSLFSPMFDFADQTAVEDTARAVLQELMNEENLEILDAGYEQSLNPPEVATATHTRQDVINPEAETASATEETATVAGKPLLQQPISRRQLFLGSRK